MKKNFNYLSALLLCLLVACQTPHPAPTVDLATWEETEPQRATKSLLKALSPAGTKVGVVIASPSLAEPNYFYHWQRDGALTMNVVVGLYEKAENAAVKSSYENRIQDYITFSRQLQKTKNLSGNQENFFRGYGEPKFNVDGTPFNGEWGRPQNDGPALQTLTLVHYILAAQAAGHSSILAQVYNRDANKSLLKSNLEFLAHHWKDTCYDLWEETRGHHFYTQLVQRRALLEGAEMADLAKDRAAAKNYRQQARLLRTAIEKHFSSAKNYIVTTLNHDAGIAYKDSQLDASVVLAAQHARGSTAASLKDPYFSATDDRVLSTAFELDKVFSKLYKVNDPKAFPEAQNLGTAIGRYPEDIYDGIATSKGNPWILLTAGMAEHHFQVARDLQAQGLLKISALNVDFYNRAMMSKVFTVGEKITPTDPRFAQVIAGLRHLADAYLRRVQHHAAADGGFAEEIQRDTGLPQGARDLTWNYASLITALNLR
jgi:glucoamylase